MLHLFRKQLDWKKLDDTKIRGLDLRELNQYIKKLEVKSTAPHKRLLVKLYAQTARCYRKNTQFDEAIRSYQFAITTFSGIISPLADSCRLVANCYLEELAVLKARKNFDLSRKVLAYLNAITALKKIHLPTDEDNRTIAKYYEVLAGLSSNETEKLNHYKKAFDALDQIDRPTQVDKHRKYEFKAAIKKYAKIASIARDTFQFTARYPQNSVQSASHNHSSDPPKRNMI